MLQVAVHRDHRVAARVFDAGEQRALVAEVAGKADPPNVRMLTRRRHYRLPGAVAAPVVHEYDFEAADESWQHRRYRVDERSNIRFLVVHRGNDGELWSIDCCALSADDFGHPRWARY
jgi:hypothetical protein